MKKNLHTIRRWTRRPSAPRRGLCSWLRLRRTADRRCRRTQAASRRLRADASSAAGATRWCGRLRSRPPIAWPWHRMDRCTSTCLVSGRPVEVVDHRSAIGCSGERARSLLRV